MLKRNQILVFIFVVVFGLLYLRLIHLQIVERNRFSMLAIENAAKIVPDPAPRGVIYDRYGKVMVENRPIFAVRVLPYVLSGKSESERGRILNTLSRLLGERVDLKVSATEPIMVKDNIPLATAIRIEEKKRELEGVIVYSRPVRLYPYVNLASHLLGHIGEIEAEELERLRGQGYRLGDVVGKDGVEKIYDRQIRGRDGGKRVEVDVYGTPTRILESLDPVSGADMKLTIDLEMQQAAEKALGKQEGAVVVMDVRSGEILAIASYPNFDPNIFTDSRENWKWKRLERENHPFMNRALAIYPPGSIYKVITLAAALEEGKASADEIMDCPGYYKVYNDRIAKCWLEGGHGPVTVREGLVWSCDIVFYELGKRVGPDLLAKYSKKFGLGMRTGIDLPQEKRGFVPTSKWKEKNMKEPWYDGDSINYGIGQGWVQVTPLQMASVYGSIASGKIVKPYVVKEIKDRNGEVLYKGKPEVIGDVPLSLENLELVRSALRDVVLRATGVATRFTGIPAAGKTGTAENPGKAHAWFICYAPYDDPEIVIASFVAEGEHGDRASAYVARDILKWYKINRVKRDFPPDGPFSQYIVQRGRIRVPYRGNPRD
ncbi:MAG: penicillin-binding protein 2 [Candidatus Margulisiibacteriota bacterium]